MHATNEYPFLIGNTGFSVLPLSSLKLDHRACAERVSTGIPRLDSMLGGKGFYRGTSVLVSGTAGSGKSSLAAHFIDAACRRGERALYMSSEQSPDEIVRNMRSVGIELERWLKRGLLRFYTARPGSLGLERHLVAINEVMELFAPQVVAIDSMTNFSSIGGYSEVKSMVTRLIDIFKARQITTVFTSLTPGDSVPEMSVVGVSSQMDTWLLLRNLESNGERNRGLYVLKSRGMAHSNQIREFVLTDHGIQLLDVYVGASGLLTGSARVSQAARDRAEALQRMQRLDRKTAELKIKRQQLEAQIASLRSAFEMDERELLHDICEMQAREKQLEVDRGQMRRIRRADIRPEHGTAGGHAVSKLQ